MEMYFGQEFVTPHLHQIIALWPSGKAMDSDSIIHRFESYQRNHAEIAQLVEQLNRNQ